MVHLKFKRKWASCSLSGTPYLEGRVFPGLLASSQQVLSICVIVRAKPKPALQLLQLHCSGAERHDQDRHPGGRPLPETQVHTWKGAPPCGFSGPFARFCHSLVPYHPPYPPTRDRSSRAGGGTVRLPDRCLPLAGPSIHHVGLRPSR